MKKSLAPASSPSAAGWLMNDLQGPRLVVGTFVPVTFPAVVRVLYPFTGTGGQKVTWAALARELGVSLDGTANGERLCLDYEAKTGEKIYIDFGTLDYEVASALADVLGRHTATPDKCYFAVWTGYSGIRNDLAGAPVVKLSPEREMYLLERRLRPDKKAYEVKDTLR